MNKPEASSEAPEKHEQPAKSASWRRRLAASALLLVILGAVFVSRRMHKPTPHERPLRGALTSSLPPKDVIRGVFRIQWTQSPAQLRILNNQSQQVVWTHKAGENFLAAGVADAHIEDSHGSFFIHERPDFVLTEQILESWTESQSRVILKGHFNAASHPGKKWDFQIDLEQIDRQQLAFRVRVKDTQINRLFWLGERSQDERIYGFGTQFSGVDMRGRLITVISQEQGIGRGLQPLSGLLDVLARSGGQWDSSYAPSALMVSSEVRALALNNTELSSFDFREPGRMTVKLYGQGVSNFTLDGRLFAAKDPLSLLEATSRWTGRMPELPDWVHEGAIIGMQGGDAAVRKSLKALDQEQVPVTAFWLQDWVGKRKTSIGWQLWWNWELDRQHYAQWSELVSELKSRDIRVLAYVNPFLVKLDGKAEVRRNLFQEAEAKGYLVKDAEGQVVMVPITSFDAAMVDLSSEAARRWLKEVLKEAMIGEGLSGWMADFGEALPFHAKLQSGQSAYRYHNQYPVAWAQLNRELIREQQGEGEFLFFSRSGFSKSPGQSSLFWLGDQLMSWDSHDGLGSAMNGLLSSGLSGFSLQHGDIGGYTSVSAPGLTYHRSPELFKRWMEWAALTSVFRTHEGNEPGKNLQFDSNPDILKFFGRCARLYKALGGYRRSVVKQAADKGWPVARHLWLHYPDDVNVFDCHDQFLMGSELLFAPVLEPGVTTRRVYFPEGRWLHFWSQKTYTKGWQSVEAPLGQPALFVRAKSPWRAKILQGLKDCGLKVQ